MKIKQSVTNNYQQITSYITGHSAANEEIAEQAAKKGATFITHLFNAMLPVSCLFVNILKLQLRLL